MKSKIFKLSASFFILFLFSCSSNRILFKKIDLLITNQTPRSFNGIVLISKKEKIKYIKSYGFTNSNSKKLLTNNNKYEIGTNTAQISSVLVLKELEKGNINLNASMHKYLDSLIKPWNDTIKVSNLLNHSGGFTDFNSDSKLDFKPGTDFRYSYLSNIFIGQILELTTKKKYSELVDNLFKELRINNTHYYSKKNVTGLVNGHIYKNDSIRGIKNSFISKHYIPGIGVISTAEDLVKWNNRLHNGKILKPETYKLMITPSNKFQDNIFGNTKMGFGYNIRIISESGIKYYVDIGANEGFTTFNMYIPKSKISLIILENQMVEGNTQFYYEKEIKNMLIKELVNKNFR